MSIIESNLKLIKSGVSEIISEVELEYFLKNRSNLVIKVGFDPTTTDLHLGHVVILRKLRQFQDLGYYVYFLIGDFTAIIGDPSGRSKSRKFLSKKDVVYNYRTYSRQIFKILNPDFTKFYFNSSWFCHFDVYNLLNLVSFTTLSRLLERNDFKKRYDLNKPIGINEIIYPFLQSYDSVFIESDIEVGGIDQKFNFLLSRYIQKKCGQSPQVVIMMPILLGIDGVNKMSKSLDNCINLNDDSYDVYCKVMSIPDFLMYDYFTFLSIWSESKFNYEKKLCKNPVFLKRKLAFKIVLLLHGVELAKKASSRFKLYFSDKSLTEDIDKVVINIFNESILLYEVLQQIKFVSSNSEFKRLLGFKSIKVNSVIVIDRKYLLYVNSHYYLQIGKKKVVRVYLKKI